MHVEITEAYRDGEEGTTARIQVLVRDPLPNVPEDMLIAVAPGPDDRAIFIPQKNHVFADATGSTPGYPAELVTAAARYVAGEVKKSAAETLIADVLTRWSRATNRSS